VNISKVFCRNFILEVSGKQANKALDVIIDCHSNGSGYTVYCNIELASLCSGLNKSTVKQCTVDVNHGSDCISIGEVLVEIMYQFNRIIQKEQEEISIAHVMTSLLKNNFTYNSDIQEELCEDMEIVIPEYSGSVRSEYFEKAEMDDETYTFTYRPVCMGFKGTGKSANAEISYLLL